MAGRAPKYYKGPVTQATFCIYRMDNDQIKGLGAQACNPIGSSGQGVSFQSHRCFPNLGLGIGQGHVSKGQICHCHTPGSSSHSLDLPTHLLSWQWPSTGAGLSLDSQGPGPVSSQVGHSRRPGYIGRMGPLYSGPWAQGPLKWEPHAPYYLRGCPIAFIISPSSAVCWQLRPGAWPLCSGFVAGLAPGHLLLLLKMGIGIQRTMGSELKGSM